MRTALLSALLTGTLAAQQPDPTFQSQTREVLLEVVIRDAHGKLVTKIDPSQVSIYEDGVKQDIKSFRLVPGREVRAESRKETASPAAEPNAPLTIPRPAANPLRTVNIVCLILNDLTPETRAFAFDAARKFVDKELRPDTYIGVFSLDATGLRPAYPFSNNREHLVKAIEMASVDQLRAMTGGGAALFNGLNGLNLNSLTNPLSSGANTTTVGPGGAIIVTGPGGVSGGLDVPSTADPLGTRGDMGVAINGGLREIDALRKMVQQLAQLPFQKTVLLMSTGLTRPPDQIEYWNSLIKAANKGGVTFYGVDVHGLDTGPSIDQVSTPSTTSLNFLQTTASLSRSQSTVGLFPKGPTAPGGSSVAGWVTPTQQLMEASHQTDYLRYGVLSANVQEALREISESTGGFVIANTNNTEALLAKVMEEVDTHYELAYRPALLSNDGHFRKIEVRLNKPDLRVETRTGYFAVPETGEGPLTPGDFGALQALDAKPHAFDFTSKAYPFRNTNAIAWEVPIANLTGTPEPPAKHRYHAYLLALVKNAQGEVVARVSKDVSSEVADNLLPALNREPMIYEHAINLGLGRYTIETAVVDQEGNRASTNTFTIDNREDQGPAVSDIALVRRVTSIDRAPDSTDPFEVPGKRAQPFLSTTLAAGAKPYIYFVVYPDQSADATLRVQFLKNGRVLATQKSVLPKPDASGAVPMAIQPAASPGDFEVRVTVEQGRKSTQRALKYTIAGN
jgi:VWFA-related protein